MYQHAHLDVLFLAAIREVGGGDQGSLVVDDDALGVETGHRVGGDGSGVVADVGERGAEEGPVGDQDLSMARRA